MNSQLDDSFSNALSVGDSRQMMYFNDQQDH